MRIEPIQNGIVIDHLTAGTSLKLYHLLGLDHLECPVALIQNAVSEKMGSKDIIKIGADLAIDYDMIAYVDPGATVNVVKNGVLYEKKTLSKPKRLVNVLKCANPRCITSTEQELEQVFVLSDEEKGVYRCMYCEAKAK